jgi:hypothetical protein
LGVEARDQLDHRCVGFFERLVEDLILAFGPAPDADDQIGSVFGHRGLEAPFLLVRAVVHQAIAVLGIPQAMVIQLLEIVDAGQLLALFGLVISAVEEALVIRRPSHSGELDPSQMVLQIPTGSDLFDLPFPPVRTAVGKPVGEEFSVVTDLPTGQGDGPLLGKLIRIQQLARFAVQTVSDVQHALILQAVVAGEEVAAPSLNRDTITLVIPQLRQPSLQRFPLRQLFEQSEGHLVLCGDPGPRLLAVRILQPAIRIWNFGSVVDIDVIRAVGRRILDLEFGGCHRAWQGHREHQKEEQGGPGTHAGADRFHQSTFPR